MMDRTTSARTVISGAAALLFLVVAIAGRAADAPASPPDKASVAAARKLIHDYLSSGGPHMFVATNEREWRSSPIISVRISSSTLYVGTQDGVTTKCALKSLGEITTLFNFGGHFLLFSCQEKEAHLLFRNGLSAADRLVDALSVLQRSARTALPPDRDPDFEAVVSAYRNAATKPAVPEAARRFEVQAEGAINDKDLDAAADYYAQALDIVPWSPTDHFNRALTLSEIGEYDDAIAEMQRYLALVPDAPDARAAQDKIYDWERKAATAN